MKKTLSLILALLMSISCASFVAADDAIADDSAVVEAPTAYDEAILFLQDKGIMQGKEDGLIHAGDDVKRYEMAILTARISTGWLENNLWEDDFANDSKYTDLAGTGAQKFYGAISYADQKGIIEGYPDGSFKPEQQVTYREALAMATRTLGYTGLAWPWGNIEKAVNLGLTEGIEDVAYTTPLNRGQVAQIIYNTLFAKVNGETLAMNIFGIDRAWETILVTADSRSVYVAGAKTTVAGQVAFQIVNENGTLDDSVYYVKDTTLEIGHPYRALFNVDEDAALVELVKAVECKSILEDNEGVTNNEGKAYDDAYPVNTLLGKYELVDKYDLRNTLANPDFDTNEIILVDAMNMSKVLVTGNPKYGFELATGNVINLDETGKYVSVKWYYSDLLDCYFEKLATNDTDTVYSIVDDEDVADLLADLYYKYVDSSATSGFSFIASAPSKSAYSHVEIWDVEGKAYGWYEEYRLGQISVKSDKKCYCGEEKKGTGYTFTDLNAGDSANNFGREYGVDATCDKCVGYEVETSIDLANAKYVIYGVNEATKTIKVVKEVEKFTGNVEDLTDMDTYYATGIVRGYRMSKGTVTIGEQNIPYGYDSLIGNAISIKNDGKVENIEHREAYSNWFAGLVNQYVEYVVVDGYVVDINVVGAKSDEWIVVENYVGISSDGYIVVGGYSTSDLKYEMFRIASYDSWKFGDKFWYGEERDEDFMKGAVYAITSYDASTDTYNVTNIFDGIVETDAAWVTVYADTNAGYRWMKTWNVLLDTVDDDDVSDGMTRYNGEWVEVRNIEGKWYTCTETPYKMTDNDKYIIITTQGNELTMPIYVYEGELIDEHYIDAAQLIVGAADKGTLILVNPFGMEGFWNENYKSSMVVVLDKVILDWVYDGYGTENAWYIQGASGYKMEAFDIFTGNFTTVYGYFNYDLELGQIYPTVDNVVVDDRPITWAEMGTYYNYRDVDAATKLVFDGVPYTFLTTDADWDDEDFVSNIDEFMSGEIYEDNRYNVVDDVAMYFVTFSEDHDAVVEIEKFDAAKHIPANTYLDRLFVTIVYDVESTDAIVYIYEDQVEVNPVSYTAKTAAAVDVVAANDRGIKATADLDYAIGTIESEIIDIYKFTETTFALVDTNTTKWTHHLRAENGDILGVQHFDLNGSYEETLEDLFTVDVKITGAGSDANNRTYEDLDFTFASADACCDIITGFTVDLDDIVVNLVDDEAGREQGAAKTFRLTVELKYDNGYEEVVYVGYALTVAQAADGTLTIVENANYDSEWTGYAIDENFHIFDCQIAG